MKELCVIGSLNMDLVTTVGEFPKPSETIFGDSFKNHIKFMRCVRFKRMLYNNLVSII